MHIDVVWTSYIQFDSLAVFYIIIKRLHVLFKKNINRQEKSVGRLQRKNKDDMHKVAQILLNRWARMIVHVYIES